MLLLALIGQIVAMPAAKISATRGEIEFAHPLHAWLVILYERAYKPITNAAEIAGSSSQIYWVVIAEGFFCISINDTVDHFEVPVAFVVAFEPIPEAVRHFTFVVFMLLAPQVSRSGLKDPTSCHAKNIETPALLDRYSVRPFPSTHMALQK